MPTHAGRDTFAARRAGGRAAAAFALAFVLALAVSGCGSQAAPGGGGPEETRTLTILAASSLTDAFGQLAGEFEERNPGVRVRISFGASSALLAQIQQGAPADVFASADEAKMRTAVDGGFVEGDPVVFARNRLIIVVPEGNPGEVRGYRDMADPGLKVVLAQEEVPVAEYAETSLEKASAEYGDGFAGDVLGNVVSREADVRASVNRVRLGDADAAFAYRSDVTPDVRGDVRTVEIPREFNVVAAYPIAALAGAGEPELARRWVEMVAGERGQEVLQKWGFEPAP